MSAPEDLLAFQLRACKLKFEREFRFHTTRRWRFDFAWPEKLIACEIDGGSWKPHGGHSTGAGFQNDRDKDDAALRLGWRVYRCTPAMVKRGQALETIIQLLGARHERD